MSDAPDYHLDIRGLDDSPGDHDGERPDGLGARPENAHLQWGRGQGEGAQESALKGRPWVGIRFDCCAAYTRIYRNPEGTAYQGRCPRCGRAVTIRVGEGGTSARFFVAE